MSEGFAITVATPTGIVRRVAPTWSHAIARMRYYESQSATFTVEDKQGTPIMAWVDGGMVPIDERRA